MAKIEQLYPTTDPKLLSLLGELVEQVGRVADALEHREGGRPPLAEVEVVEEKEVTPKPEPKKKVSTRTIRCTPLVTNDRSVLFNAGDAYALLWQWGHGYEDLVGVEDDYDLPYKVKFQKPYPLPLATVQQVWPERVQLIHDGKESWWYGTNVIGYVDEDGIRHGYDEIEIGEDIHLLVLPSNAACHKEWKQNIKVKDFKVKDADLGGQ